MIWFVRACALYNLCGAATFLVPGALPRLGVAVPASPFWLWLPALMACFAAVVLWLSSFDLPRYGSFPYWNGYVRLTFVVATFALGFGASAGGFITLLALGDLPLALGAILGLPRVLGRSHGALLLNRAVAA
jgi:hypothetical protein